VSIYEYYRIIRIIFYNVLHYIVLLLYYILFLCCFFFNQDAHFVCIGTISEFNIYPIYLGINTQLPTMFSIYVSMFIRHEYFIFELLLRFIQMSNTFTIICILQQFIALIRYTTL